jgi:transcriptional antiterminator RfaH
MNGQFEVQWFAVQTRANGEAVAEAQLRALPVETLLPLARRAVRHATRTPHLVVRPLFPGYLFAHFSAALSLRAVRSSRGVVHVLGAAHDRPWPMDDAVIDNIRARLGGDGCVELCERSFRAGDPVRVTTGPLAGWSGIFDSELSDAERVVILIETLQQGRVVLRRDYLELSDAA